MAILLFILILGILVLVHEGGHFFAARWSGIRVEEFGFGFPPRLWGFRHGTTMYSLNLIPFGGFVRIYGEQGEGGNETDSFLRAAAWKKYIVLLAGVLMNLVLAWVIITGVLVAGLPSDVSTMPHDRWARYSQSKTEALVSAGGAVAKAGLKSGDTIVTINGQTFTATDTLIEYLQKTQYPPLTIVFSRAGVTQAPIVVSPQADGSHPRYGLGILTTATLHYPWYVAPWYSIKMAIHLTGQTFAGFASVIRQLVTAGTVASDLSGPVGIAVMTGEVSRLGFISVLQFLAILSVSLAVVNVLPLPALDGGRVLFLILASLRGRPVNAKVENIVHAIGFYALIAVLIAISVRDIQRYHLVDQIRSLFR